MASSTMPRLNPNPNHDPHTTTTPTPTPTTLPAPLLRTTALLTFVPALPLCITHGALSRDIVPALGLVPLFFSSAVSLGLVLSARRRSRSGSDGGGGEDGGGVGGVGGEGGKGKGASRRLGGEAGLEGLVAASSAAAAAARGRGGDEWEEEGGEESGLGVGEEEDYEDGGGGGRRGSVLTHRILVFVVDVVLAAALMVVLVFTWIRTGHVGDRRPELAMLAAYSTMPLLANFLIHSYLAARELVAGLAIPGLVEYTAWRVVPADCPHCGHRLRPDALPPIPWYETVSRPKVSLPRITAPSISRPSLPAISVPKLSGFKGPREWKAPNWMRGRNADASLFIDDEQNERDRYRDDPDAPFEGPPSTTTAVATGSAGPDSVEQVVVGKKDKKTRGSSTPAHVDDEVAIW
ncbi:hypothetical protein F5144DRAFT_127713 [Chaetomium tenue]|uniref:Uncharacterized protein n=1 Tax=Chaetomium tenue TaxID=1854479 RepID=A0ACB7PH87_9PEZI|nr:hypothetical protein F5144DRAFT_127713 [Chaetomium globosum]